MTMHHSFTPKNLQNPHILRLQQNRDQLMEELEELREDLHLVQGIIRHKQKKLRTLNQDIAQKTRHAGNWHVVNPCADSDACQCQQQQYNNNTQPVLTCLPGGKQ